MVKMAKVHGQGRQYMLTRESAEDRRQRRGDEVESDHKEKDTRKDKK
jgi:hypothetical protein